MNSSSFTTMEKLSNGDKQNFVAFPLPLIILPICRQSKMLFSLKNGIILWNFSFNEGLQFLSC